MFKKSEKKDSSKSPRYTNGPVVKTGPTAGQNRSRNNDGSWRKKRSDSGTSRNSGSGGCFLTTAACQYKGFADNCHELETLRMLRDNFLLNSKEGEDLVAHYYNIAPLITQKLNFNDLDNIWSTVKICVKLIETGEHNSAITRYKSMVRDLEDKYI